MSGAPTSQRLLRGGRGWTTVPVLALALILLAVGQVAAGEASAGALDRAAPAASSSLAVRSAAVAPAVDRPRPGRPAQRALAGAPEPPVAPGPSPEPAAQDAPAPAPTDSCSGEGWQQRRGAAALASLRGGAERTGFAVSFSPARRGYLGLTHLQERRIEVFVRGCDVQSDELLRHVVAHELGHAYDTTHHSDGVRAAYQRARGIPASTPWYGCSGCTDFATPAGDFAEVYAQWARGASSNRSELSGSPGPDELAALATSFFGA